jgi:hypothetical protein
MFFAMRGANRTIVPAVVGLAVCVALAVPVPGLAQRAQSGGDAEAGGAASYGSAYLSLGHWAYDYIDLLIARGRITSLPPLVRPYRRIDVAAAVLEAEAEGQLSRSEMTWTAVLQEELAEEVERLRGQRTQGVGMGGEFAVGAHAMTHTHRDPLRPEGEEKLFYTMRLDVRGEAPMVAGAVRARWDNHYLNDPQFPDGRVIERRQCDPFVQECAYRSEEAYVELQLPYVRLSFGRLYRNWGLWTQDGLLLGDYAYSYDHVGYRFGSDRIALSGLYAPLGDFGGDTARHFASHRFDWMIRDNLAVAIGESVVYGGVNRRIDFNLTNPLGLWEISGSPEGTERNSLGMIEAWWRIFEDLVTYGAFMVDNTSVGDEGRSEGFSQYAGALGIQLPTLTPSFALKADLTVVSSLAYRSRVARWEYYAVDNLGLAQDKTDVIVIALQGDWHLASPSRLLLQPRLDLMWKGEDDLTDDWPDDAFTGHERILVGTVEQTIRPSLRGRWSHPYLDARWDLGLNLVKNRDHETSDWEVEFVGMLWAEARVRF